MLNIALNQGLHFEMNKYRVSLTKHVTIKNVQNTITLHEIGHLI